MNYVIDHLFDTPMFIDNLIFNEPLEKLKQERSKSRLTFKNGSEIRIYSADASNRKRVKESLMGFGSPNVVLDESSLIPDDLFATVKRMIGGSVDNCLIEIGNPWEKNHFFRAWQSSDYKKIFIDYKRGIEEGRITEKFIEEMKNESFFDVLYECKFPDDDMVDAFGWRRLLLDNEIEGAMGELPEPKGRPRLGVDIGRGDNKSVFVIRYDNVARILEKNQVADLMYQVTMTKKFMEQYGIDGTDVFIDDVGVGGGVVDRLKELDIAVNPVKEGAKAVQSDKFTNLRAEIYWLSGQWIKSGGKLERSDDFYQLSLVRYKEDTSSKLKIEPKVDLLKRGYQSPDVADAFSLTFTNAVTINTESDFAVI